MIGFGSEDLRAGVPPVEQTFQDSLFSFPSAYPKSPVAEKCVAIIILAIANCFLMVYNKTNPKSKIQNGKTNYLYCHH